MNMLVLEPNKVLASQYKDYLEQHEIKVEIAKYAQEALLAVDEKQPNLIILELALPKHSGMEFLYELRSYSDLKHIPVVIMSRLKWSESGLDESLMKQFGIVKYLYKPETSLKKLLLTIISIKASVV